MTDGFLIWRIGVVGGGRGCGRGLIATYVSSEDAPLALVGGSGAMGREPLDPGWPGHSVCGFSPDHASHGTMPSRAIFSGLSPK